MQIQKNCRLFLRDIYSYDITACHYNILEKFGFDLRNIDKENKENRNIQIGKLMKNNERITSLLRNTTESVIYNYIKRNNLRDDELILKQYDGIIVTRPLREVEGEIPLDFRSHFIDFIISFDRKRYLAFDGYNVSIKGVPFRYKRIDEILEKIARINFLNKTTIFVSMQKIYNDFINSKDPLLFCIPSIEDKYNVFLKEYGEIEITEQTTRIMNTDDIDKQRYFDFYIKPFTKSIILEFV